MAEISVTFGMELFCSGVTKRSVSFGTVSFPCWAGLLTTTVFFASPLGGGGGVVVTPSTGLWQLGHTRVPGSNGYPQSCLITPPAIDSVGLVAIRIVFLSLSTTGSAELDAGGVGRFSFKGDPHLLQKAASSTLLNPQNLHIIVVYFTVTLLIEYSYAPIISSRFESFICCVSP